jgi:hypothetical protein
MARLLHCINFHTFCAYAKRESKQGRSFGNSNLSLDGGGRNPVSESSCPKVEAKPPPVKLIEVVFLF